MLLSAESGGPTPTIEEIRAYQKEKLGRDGGLDCIIELLSLPSSGLGRWLFYPEYSGLPYLSDWTTHTEQVAPAGVAQVRQRIAEDRPSIVVFYGAGYRHWWRAVASEEFGSSSLDKASVATDGLTLFVIMQHPAARGLFLADHFVLRWCLKLMGYVSQNEVRYIEFATKNTNPHHVCFHIGCLRD